MVDAVDKLLRELKSVYHFEGGSLTNRPGTWTLWNALHDAAHSLSHLEASRAVLSLAAAARGAGRLRGRYPAKAVATEVNVAERSLPT
jgi:hypothetical protein